MNAEFYDPAPPQPQLVVSPDYVETGVAYDDSVTETVTLENRGDGDLEDVSLALLADLSGTPAPDWVRLLSSTALGLIPAGEKREIQLRFQPTAVVPEGEHTAYLWVTSANAQTVDLGLYTTVTQSGIGNVLFKLSDIYTGTLTDQGQIIQGVAGARVSIQNETVASIARNGYTDAVGEFLVEDLPTGRYRCRITANNHQEQSGRFWIKAGLTTTQEVFLEYNLVTVEWEVTEITIEDRYEITLQTTFATDVPAAVVVVEPASVTLPEMQAGDVYYGELTLTNHGLIRADDLRLQLPQDNQYYAYEMLSGVPENLGPKERITVPYRVTRLLDAPGDGDPSTGSGQASGGGVDCGYLYRCAFTFWKNTCANGQTSEQAVKQPCFNEWLKYCADGGSSGSSTWTWFQEGDDEIKDVIEEEDGGYSPWVSPRKPGTPATNMQGTENACYPEAQGDECRSECLCERQRTCQNINTKTESFVNNLTRDYQTEGPELMVKVPGDWLRVLTIYKNGHWLIGPARSGMDGLPREKTGLAFHQYGDATRGYVISAIIKDGNISYNLPPENFALKTEYAADGTLLSQQYAYTGEQIYLHKDTYKITPYDGGWRWRKKSGTWKQYDADGRWLASGTRRGTTMTVLYDTEGKVLGYGDRNGTQVIWFDYNADGWIEAVRDAEGRQISYTYDSNSRLWKARDEVLDEETTYAYDDQGRLKQVLKPGGRESNITYNDIGNVIAVTDEQGEGYLFDYDYDDYREEYYTMITSPSGAIKEVWYDEEGNTKRVDIDGTTVQTIVRDDNALITTDENGEKTRREYDEWNNVTKVLHPDGTEEVYEYEHTYQQRIRYVNTKEIETRYDYDDTGMLFRQILSAGTANEQITVFTYDLYGQMDTRTLLGDGTTPDATTTYEYNDAGRIKTIFKPDGDTVEITYNRDGKRLTWKNKNGVYRYIYDDHGDLLRITGPEPDTTTP